MSSLARERNSLGRELSTSRQNRVRGGCVRSARCQMRYSPSALVPSSCWPWSRSLSLMSRAHAGVSARRARQTPRHSWHTALAASMSPEHMRHPTSAVCTVCRVSKGKIFSSTISAGRADWPNGQSPPLDTTLTDVKERTSRASVALAGSTVARWSRRRIKFSGRTLSGKEAPDPARAMRTVHRPLRASQASAVPVRSLNRRPFSDVRPVSTTREPAMMSIVKRTHACACNVKRCFGRFGLFVLFVFFFHSRHARGGGGGAIKGTVRNARTC